MKPNLDRRCVSTHASLFTALMAVMTIAVIFPSLGIAQLGQTSKIANLHDTAVVLSREIPSDWFEQLKAMPNLQKLTIRNPALENFKVTQLRELKNLTAFSAEDFSINSHLADIVAVNIAQLPGLKTVEFHRTGLTGRGLQALSQSPTVELILDGEELVTDADFKHVAAITSLTSLVLDSTPIDAGGLKALQAASGLRRLVLRRHPSGSNEQGCKARTHAIADFPNLEQLELADTGYNDLVMLKANKSLRLLTLRNCGAFEASKSLKQLTQLERIEIDNCDIRNESFEHVKSRLAEIGVEFADVSVPAADFRTRNSELPDEATRLARRALEELDVGQHFPAFWIEWNHHWSEIPTMAAEPIRSVHRLKRALTAEHQQQPGGQITKFAYAPGQFFMQHLSTTNRVGGWEQITYGDEALATSREGQTDRPFTHLIRNGVREFEESLGLSFPRPLQMTHQHLWWGTPTHHNLTSSSVSPLKVAYTELPEESFTDEICRVFQAPGRSERLWVSKTTGRLRGALHYIHQGYFTPFYKQDVVTKIVGRRVETNDEYRELFSGPGALAKEVQDQLSQTWAEHEFDRAYPGTLVILDDYREIAQDRWFPFKVISSSWHHNEKDQGKYDFHVAESVVTEIAINRKNLEPYWTEFLPKVGEMIQDLRHSVPVEYQFNNDRTEDDVQTLVNERLLENARKAIANASKRGPSTDPNARNDVVANRSPKANGTVLAIDANNGLAVISLGESDGIERKQFLDVMQEEKMIARLRVITVYKNRCVARTTDQIEQAAMKSGDKVLSFAATPSP